MTSPSFDLTSTPWMPVRQGQQTLMVGLRELYLRAREFDDLAVPVPPAASGIWRILYAITARITDLDDATSWQDRQDKVLDRGGFDPDRVADYFDKHQESFDLFHPERPWLQDPRLAVQCPKSSGANKLVFDRPAGSNQVWFGHHTDADPVPVPAAEAAWHLVAQLYYGASGRCTSREVDGQKLANSNAGPLRSSMSYHPLGGNLFESLVLGVPAPHTANDEPDLCPWERPAMADPLKPPPPPTWPGGLLTGRFQHAILLVPDADGRHVIDAYVTWGRRVTIPATDPYVIRRLSKQGNWYQLPADGARALWRDVPALLCDVNEETGQSRRPAILLSAQDFDDGQQRVRAFGFDQDGQAKDRQWFTSVTPPILRWKYEQDPEAAVGAVSLVRAAEQAGSLLAYVMKRAWNEATETEKSTGPWVDRAVTYFWFRAEDLFWTHLEDRTWDVGGKSYRRLGHAAVDWATDSEAHLPRFAAAIQSAHRWLTGERGKGNKP